MAIQGWTPRGSADQSGVRHRGQGGEKPGPAGPWLRSQHPSPTPGPGTLSLKSWEQEGDERKKKKNVLTCSHP